MAKNKDYFGEAILTPTFRAAFASVFETNKNGKFSITMLFPKGTDLSELRKEAETVALRFFNNKIPKNFKSPFKDGDVPNSAGNVFDGFEGHVVVNAWTGINSQPKVVDQKVQPIISRDDFYSGCYARAKVTPFAYSTDGNNGVSFFLGNVQKVKDGEPFGPISDPSKDFTAVEPPEDDDNTKVETPSFLD